MRRIEYDRYGGPEVMALRKFTLRQPDSDEVVVRVVAASINPMDWKIRNGDMKLFTGFRFPRAMGTDFSGVVLSAGRSVTRFQAGDPVVGTVSMKHAGAFAPMLVASQRLLVENPAICRSRKQPACQSPE